MGLGVRVVRGEASGYAYSEDLSMECMVQAARTAAQISKSGQTVSPQRIRHNTHVNHYQISSLSLAQPGDVKVALLGRVDKAARAFDSKIVRVEVGFVEGWSDILVVSSEGMSARDQQPMVRLAVNVVAEHAGKRQSGRTGIAKRRGLDLFDEPEAIPESLGSEAARLAVAMLDADEAPAGPMQVVLAAGESGILLHEAVGHGLEADFNRKKTSNYSDRVGQMVASPLCTVVDDATIEGARGSVNVDDEASPTGRTVLIEEGVLTGYLHDRISARYFRVAPTGNGRRESFRHPPLPRMTNTMLLGGSSEPEEMIRRVQRGIFAKHFSGGQVNINNGDFVFSLTESYLIEDGRVTAPLRGVNLIGNGPEVLRNVTMVGNDFKLSSGTWTCGKDGQSVPVGIGTPTLVIGQITVGGTRIS
jgi:TldD protein